MRILKSILRKIIYLLLELVIIPTIAFLFVKLIEKGYININEMHLICFLGAILFASLYGLLYAFVRIRVYYFAHKFYQKIQYGKGDGDDVISEKETEI